MTSQLNPLVIINPHSASGKTGRRWPKVAPHLLKHLPQAEFIFTQRSGEATELVRASLQDAPRRFSRSSGIPHNGHIWYKPRLGPPKSESHNELRQGTEILMEICSILGQFQKAKSLILYWFYNSFSDFSISQH